MINNSISNKQIKISATEKARQYIREKSINYGFYPGESINELELSRELGISRAPIREALSSLINEGLIVFNPGKGFFCRKLNFKEVSELIELRSDIELSALPKIIEKSDNIAIEELIKKYSKFLNNTDLMDQVVLVDFDEEFHLDLMSLAENDERIKTLKNINGRIRFVREINLETPNLKNKFLNEHISILEAIKDKDLKKSFKFMEMHLGVHSENLEDLIKEGLARIYGNEIGL